MSMTMSIMMNFDDQTVILTWYTCNYFVDVARFVSASSRIQTLVTFQQNMFVIMK